MDSGVKVNDLTEDHSMPSRSPSIGSTPDHKYERNAFIVHSDASHGSANSSPAGKYGPDAFAPLSGYDSDSETSLSNQFGRATFTIYPDDDKSASPTPADHFGPEAFTFGLHNARAVEGDEAKFAAEHVMSSDEDSQAFGREAFEVELEDSGDNDSEEMSDCRVFGPEAFQPTASDNDGESSPNDEVFGPEAYELPRPVDVATPTPGHLMIVAKLTSFGADDPSVGDIGALGLSPLSEKLMCSLISLRGMTSASAKRLVSLESRLLEDHSAVVRSLEDINHSLAVLSRDVVRRPAFTPPL